MMTKFSDVMKRFRRGAHVHGQHWRAIMICPTMNMLDIAWEEALATMQGTSHAKGLEINHTSRRMQTANGAVMQFAIVDPMDAADQIQLRMSGMQYTQLVWLATYPPKAVELGEVYKRSSAVVPEDMVTQFSSL